MSTFDHPSDDETRALEALAAHVVDVQRTLVENHPALTMADRAAHQQQIAASRVVLTVAGRLPPELDGLGVFQPHPRAGLNGIGRLSTGLGCPHAEPEPDFLGLMLAFVSPSGRRIDFVAINDPTAPTRSAPDFMALLQATADAARGGGIVVSEARLLAGLVRHAGVRAPAIAAHILAQTLRTARSSTAFQQYWTGIVRAREVLGKFTFVPAGPQGTFAVEDREHAFSREWALRQRAGDVTFRVRWIPFVSEAATPLANLTAPWDETQSVEVGAVTFPALDPTDPQAPLVALLASEMGANPGHWEETPGGGAADLPATEFTAARMLTYRKSQESRGALHESLYASFFETGRVEPDLAGELRRRLADKRARGHAVPLAVLDLA